MSERIPLPVTADLSDSMRDDESDAWVVDSDAGSLCEMTCPADDAEAFAKEIVTALTAHDKLVGAVNAALVIQVQSNGRCEHDPEFADDCLQCSCREALALAKGGNVIPE